MQLEKSVQNKISAVKERAGTPAGAIAIAAIVGLGSFFLSRKMMRGKTLASAMEAFALASSAYGAMRKFSAN